MPIVHLNLKGANGGGGPSVFAYKTASELKKRGFKIIYDNPQNANASICIIETGKVLKACRGAKTKVLLRCDGIYNDEYNKKFNRPIRNDMVALHNSLKHSIPLVDALVLQSEWSRDRIYDEIVERRGTQAIIHNGVDIKTFKPSPYKKSDTVRLVHVGLMRNGYLMESLMGCYNELIKRGHKVSLTMVGSMDGECKKVFIKYRADPGIRYIPAMPNTKLPEFYSSSDIYIGPRQGSSSDNVIAEAQACGLGVVVPSWGGNVDMVKDGESGVVVPSGHWDYGAKYWSDLADGVEKIIDGGIENFKNAARKHAVKELTIEKMVDRYLDVLGM